MNDCNHDTVEMLAARQCAPVLAGIKPANLLITKGRTQQEIEKAFRETDLSCKHLSCQNGRDVWFVYKNLMVSGTIKFFENRRFLEECGYWGMDLDSMLERMAVRFREYQRGEGEFPHEMGVFLGYPLADVRGFIEKEGREFLYQGYWKVYENVEECKRLFSLYNWLKKQFVKEMEKGKTLWQAAVSIQIPQGMMA